VEAAARRSQTEEVTLTLTLGPLGSYAATAPYDCPKSALILAEAGALLAREPLSDDLWGAVNGLALLATGHSDYLGPRTLDRPAG